MYDLKLQLNNVNYVCLSMVTGIVNRLKIVALPYLSIYEGKTLIQSSKTTLLSQNR